MADRDVVKTGITGLDSILADDTPGAYLRGLFEQQTSLSSCTLCPATRIRR